MKTYNNTKKNNGFTLVELLIYMGLFAILLTVITSLFTAVLEIRTTTEAGNSVEEDSKYILNRLTYDIQRATAVADPVTRGTQGSTLSLIINGAPLTYTLASENITLTTNGNSYTLNGYNSYLSTLSFQKLGNTSGHDTIKINFTIKSRTARSGIAESKDIQTTIGLRDN